jgi:small subunit ribosomal protein S8
MSMQDPLSDMLTRIRNASRVSKNIVRMPYSNLKEYVATVLRDEGYINDFVVERTDKPELIIFLKYHQGTSVIEKIKRVSRPGVRVYRAVADLPKVMGGLGVAIISTPKGVMSDKAARQQNVGGEVLCIVY